MSLSTGAHIGPYTIGDEIGSGGMGIVYRATDQNLKRDVAIKVLPESFSTDVDWVARFEREAQTLAALNHPNIAQVYGLERANCTTALVMELVEGPTLADRIADGPLPPDEALGIAMQVADALEAAHGQGIVHRDLKPANIKLKPDGTVKVLDFGIAKTLDIRTASGQPAAMTTPAMTHTGIILGTAAYMSPEQARGRPIDQRTDIWAFGCLLYEMLSGQLAFGGEDVQETLARVIATDADVAPLPETVPAVVRRAIKVCLQRDLRQRIADIRDVRLMLEGKFDSEKGAVPTAGNPQTASRGPLLITSSLAVLAGAAAVGLVAWIFWPSSAQQVVKRFAYDLPTGQAFGQPGSSFVAASPDGDQFVYVTDDGLYRRRMDELGAQLIRGPGSELAAPAFSPDGQSIVYFHWGRQQLERVAVGGGTPLPIASTDPLVGGLNWATDGSILFNQSAGIYRVSANGGERDLLIRRATTEGICCASLLPDGDTVLFGVSPNAEWDASGQIVVQSLSTGDRTMIVQGGHDARYLPTGHLVYVTGGVLYAVGFDVETLTVTSAPVPVVQGVNQTSSGDTAAASYDVSSDGTLVYVPGGATGSIRGLIRVNRDGREEPIAVPPRPYTSPRLSPNGTQLALNARDEVEDIWIWDFVRETLTPLTRGPSSRFPVWSPDGDRIAYSYQQQNLYWRAADGSGAAEQLAHSDDGQIFPTAFLPDGSGILVYGSAGGNDDDISVFRFADKSLTPLLHEAYGERMPAISPDGRWLAYVSNESGSEQVYVRAFPDVDTGGRTQVSQMGGTQPLWWQSPVDPDDQRIYYRNAGALFGVKVLATDPTLTLDVPEEILTGQFTTALGGRTYDVSLDGEHFLMLREFEDNAAIRQVVVVLNWFEDLKRLVPTD